MPSSILTFSPIRTPFNLYSESLDGSTVELLQKLRLHPSLEQVFNITQVSWPCGYGSVEHDALPPFFQPIANLELKTEELTLFNQGIEGSIKLSKLEIILYDDTIAIAQSRWNGEGIKTPPKKQEILDEQLTTLCNQLLGPLIEEAFQPCVQKLNEGKDQKIFRQPKAFDIYSDVGGHGTLPTVTMWVARTCFLERSEIPAEWLDWAGVTENSLQNIGESGVSIGSGNSIFLGDDIEDFSRAMCLCQYYSAILSLYQGMLTRDLDEMQQVLLSSGIVKVRRELQRKIEHKLDHLDFVRLRHEQALYGLQGQRRSLVQIINNAWQTREQFDNVMGWSALLHERINRLYRSRQLRQSRFIQTLLAFIGGLSVIDLVLTLYEGSLIHEADGVPGVLDVMGSLPIDAAIYAAIIFILIIVTMVYCNEE